MNVLFKSHVSHKKILETLWYFFISFITVQNTSFQYMHGNKTVISRIILLLFYDKGLSSTVRCSLSLWLSCNWQEKFELWRKLVFGIESVGEINSSNSAVGVDLNSKSLYVICTISSSGEIRQVELNLIPSFIQSHGHCTDEWLNSCS